jgi:hypothetical protein
MSQQGCGYRGSESNCCFQSISRGIIPRQRLLIEIQQGQPKH